ARTGMSRRRARRRLLAVGLVVAATAAGAAGVRAAGEALPGPCPGVVGFGCPPVGVPSGISLPGPSPRPSSSPTELPGPTPLPGPVPAPGVNIPTDVGFSALKQQV